MQEHMTPARIANSINQDTSFCGYYLLVEGESDARLYRKIVHNEHTRLKVTFGKKQMREVYKILTERNFDRKFGIRDADFIRIPENPKYDPAYDLNIFITDGHDSEVMIINSDALNDFLLTISSDEKIKSFINIHGDIREKIFKLCYPIACLRLANKIYDLGLSFKPDKPEGNKIKYKKFICEKNLKFIGNNEMINTIIEYSTNRGRPRQQLENVISKLELVMEKFEPSIEIFNGHDLTEVLFIICEKGIKSTSKSISCIKGVEDMLYLSFNKNYFTETTLYKMVKALEEKCGLALIK